MKILVNLVTNQNSIMKKKTNVILHAQLVLTNKLKNVLNVLQIVNHVKIMQIFVRVAMKIKTSI